HSPIILRRQLSKLLNQHPIRIKKFFWFVTSEPLFEHLQMRRILLDARKRYLMRPPETFELVSIDLCRSRPALRRAQDDHWPSWTRCIAFITSFLLHGFDHLNAVV